MKKRHPIVYIDLMAIIPVAPAAITPEAPAATTRPAAAVVLPAAEVQAAQTGLFPHTLLKKFTLS